MHLFSKIVGISQPISDIAIPNHYDQHAIVEDYDCQIVDKNLASFKIRSLYAPGLHFQDTHIQAYQDVEDHFYTTEDHVRYFFYIKGNTNVEKGAGNASYGHDVGMLQRNYLDDNGGGGTVHIKKGDVTHHIILKMSREFFLRLLDHEDWIFEDNFYRYVEAGKPENRVNETLYMDLKMLSVVQEILESKHMKHNRLRFICMKIRELLFYIHQLTSYGKPAAMKRKRSVPELKLEKIRAYLALHIIYPPTIPQIAIQFGVNEGRLKEDFKHKYGVTIYAFVIHQRMEKAKDLLMEDFNVNEISARLGYRSVSHFIKVFKNYHGSTPKQVLKNRKLISGKA